MRNAENSTCSAVGNPFELFLDARISKSISSFASRDRIGKPAFLTTRLAQSRRENITLFLALRRCVRHVASPKDASGTIGREQRPGTLLGLVVPNLRGTRLHRDGRCHLSEFRDDPPVVIIILLHPVPTGPMVILLTSSLLRT
jgi:hypothetical protein